MKKLFLTIVIIFSSIFLFSQEQEQLNLPGDNLNLYSVLNLFQKSETLEDFEKNLNNENSKVNNLDLNGNEITDYIHVVDHVNGSSHSIVLQVAININEKQDIAVILVEKINGETHIQIIGDEDLYGKDYIVEPKPSTPNPGYTNNYVQPISSWSIIGYMYNPYYRVYTSPYYFGYYPNYWHPWNPIYYNTYYNYHKPYYSNYRRGYIYRDAHKYYAPHRNTSPYYKNNYYHYPNYNRQPQHNRPQQHNNYQQNRPQQHNNYQQNHKQPQHNNYQQNRPQQHNKQNSGVKRTK